jgi:fumarylacetoacetate (FAA) hydrolase
VIEADVTDVAVAGLTGWAMYAPISMKLATYKDGSRDGQLVVVSRDLTLAHYATDTAHTMQAVLDDWHFMAPQLQELTLALNRGRTRHAFPFDPSMCMAPMPRAYQCVRGAAFASYRHLLVEAGVLASSPGRSGTTRLQADLLTLAGDAMLGALDPMPLVDEAQGLDFEASLAVITGDIAAASPPAQALQGVRLLMLANTWCLREVQAQERAAGVGAVHSRPAQSFSPVAITPDELGDAWAQGRVGLTLQTQWNGRGMGLGDAAADMTLHLGQVLSQVVATRALRAGAVVTTGPVSHAGVGEGDARQWPQGFHCIFEKRAMEMLQQGQASTGYLKCGDTVRVDMKGRDGLSVFGALQAAVLGDAQA